MLGIDKCAWSAILTTIGEINMTAVDTVSVVGQIGETAGQIWQLLNENGPTKIAELVKSLDCPRDQVMQGIGWLAREDKIRITIESRSRIVELID